MAYEQWMPVSRRGGGEFFTNSFTVPTGIDTVNVHLDVADADFSTPDLTVTAIIEVSIDNGQSWIFQMSSNWVGQTPPPETVGGRTGWYASVNNLSVFSGQLVRVHFITTGTFRWGLEGESI